MNASNIPQGLFGIPDLSEILDQATKVLPPEVSGAIKDTVGKILDPGNPDVKIGDPQPAGTPPIPVEPGTKPMDAAIKALDAVIGALDVVLKLGFLIPDQYEAPLKALRGALATIRGWLD
jgi:hypothetical protein